MFDCCLSYVNLPVFAMHFCSVLHVPAQPHLIPFYYDGYANIVMLIIGILFCCVCTLCHFLCVVRSTLWCLCIPHLAPCILLCVCVCMCALPALLLNNPAHYLLLPDHRKGSRALVVPSSTQVREKSLNVPQGKRPQTGPTVKRGPCFITYLSICDYLSQDGRCAVAVETQTFLPT